MRGTASRPTTSAPAARASMRCLCAAKASLRRRAPKFARSKASRTCSASVVLPHENVPAKA